MTPDQPSKKLVPELGWIESLSRLLDSRFAIPGTGVKFGLDPVIGLIPVVGDVSGMFISAFLISILIRRGGSRKVLILMILNVAIDTVVGAIPIVGSVFDFAFKANNRNIQLLKEHYHEGKHEGQGTWIIVLIFLLVFAMVGLVLFGMYKLLAYLIGLF